jgi:hypothetical protein
MSLDIARFLLGKFRDGALGIGHGKSRFSSCVVNAVREMGRVKARKTIKLLSLIVIFTTLLLLSGYWGSRVIALPPPQEIPEEILRTKIIIEARSPIDGKLLTAAEYIQLQAQLQLAPPPKLDPNIREQIFLLRLRKTLLQFFPFLNF